MKVEVQYVDGSIDHFSDREARNFMESFKEYRDSGWFTFLTWSTDKDNDLVSHEVTIQKDKIISVVKTGDYKSR